MASITCRNGETFPNTHTHTSVQEARLCWKAEPTPRPRKAEETPKAYMSQINVPAGRYAITGEDGETKFYRVDRPTEGRWTGFTFVKQVTGVTPDGFAIRFASSRAHILQEIGKDVQGSMLRYGREIGQCGHCGRTLTNPESRLRGIGPVCAGRMGW